MSHVYIALCDGCGLVIAASVDDERTNRTHLSEFVATQVAAGFCLERVTMDDVRARKWGHAQGCKRDRRASKATQERLV